MDFELIVLGVISALRPSTSQAAVIALLKAPAARRTLLAYNVVGLAVSIAIGLVALAAVDGLGSTFGRRQFAAVFDLVAGVAALAFAAGVQRGRVTGPRGDTVERPESRLTAHLHHPSAATAAAAGVATHIPGLIYLVALNTIAAAQPSIKAASAAAQVTVYNLFWFAVPLTAFAFAILAPDTAVAYLDRATGWARHHQNRLLVIVFGGLGAYLTVKGVLNLT